MARNDIFRRRFRPTPIFKDIIAVSGLASALIFSGTFSFSDNDPPAGDDVQFLTVSDSYSYSDKSTVDIVHVDGEYTFFDSQASRYEFTGFHGLISEFQVHNDSYEFIESAPIISEFLVSESTDETYQFSHFAEFQNITATDSYSFNHEFSSALTFNSGYNYSHFAEFQNITATESYQFTSFAALSQPDQITHTGSYVFSNSVEAALLVEFTHFAGLISEFQVHNDSYEFNELSVVGLAEQQSYQFSHFALTGAKIFGDSSTSYSLSEIAPLDIAAIDVYQFTDSTTFSLIATDSYQFTDSAVMEGESLVASDTFYLLDTVIAPLGVAAIDSYQFTDLATNSSTGELVSAVSYNFTNVSSLDIWAVPSQYSFSDITPPLDIAVVDSYQFTQINPFLQGGGSIASIFNTYDLSDTSALDITSNVSYVFSDTATNSSTGDMSSTSSYNFSDSVDIEGVMPATVVASYIFSDNANSFGTGELVSTVSYQFTDNNPTIQGIGELVASPSYQFTDNTPTVTGQGEVSAAVTYQFTDSAVMEGQGLAFSETFYILQDATPPIQGKSESQSTTSYVFSDNAPELSDTGSPDLIFAGTYQFTSTAGLQDRTYRQTVPINVSAGQGSVTHFTVLVQVQEFVTVEDKSIEEVEIIV